MNQQTIQLIITSLTPIAVMVIGYLIKRSTDKQAAEVKEYRKEVNGHMSTLIETGNKLAAAEATAVEKEKGEVKAADLKAESKATPVAEIKVETVTVEAKTAEVKADTVIKKK